MTRTRAVANSSQVDYDTARVPHRSTAEQAATDARKASARKNLAAIVCDWYNVRPGGRNAPAAVQLAARDFVELADILGLDAPAQRAPGRCACGAVLGWSEASTAGPRSTGRCLECRKAAP